ncbi:MAG TPA: DNA phosphorothioation-associated putative methyltransferase [Verrucomicrobiae bacterium]|nr:DNA phosphorothioation-associated putative methyltransferase [Verrucomicrobiae bacterium]
MNLAEYRDQVGKIPYGKRLPKALYVHREGLAGLDAELGTVIDQVVARYQVSQEFNLVKFRTDELKLSFLAYPEFETDPHPALRHAITIDLAMGKARHTDYAGNANPPILHRKESFLPGAHPLRGDFESLTRAEEEAGLYENPETIGFKLNWERLLEAKGLAIEGHRLIQKSRVEAEPQSEAQDDFEDKPPAVIVERHKTALTRYELSKPVKSLLEYGVLRSGMSFFDYGCGQGSDVKGLVGLGYQADGWDPVFRPESSKREADVVNLGYVVNVIEDPAERIEALVDSYRHAKRLLVVSALITETVDTGRATQYRDGVLTRWNTFQKFYDQQELQQFIEDALETTAVPVGLGVFYVFRDPSNQQDFLSARSRRTIDWTQISARLGLGGPPADRWEALYAENKELLDAFGSVALSLGHLPSEAEFGQAAEVVQKLGSLKRALRAFVQGRGAKELRWDEMAARFGIGVRARPQWELLCEQHKDLLEALWKVAMELGRMPAPEEFSRQSDLVQAVGSAKRGMALLERKGGGNSLKKVAEARRNDLLVYLGLANLRKRVPFGHLSPRLRLDVKEFFGNYQRALQEGLELLYAAGDPGEIELACEELKLGWQDEQALYVHRSVVGMLPGVLRAYVGCATALFGDLAQADLVKIHKASGKVTFLGYDNFEGEALPELQHRIKVNLKTRWVQAFDHRGSGQLLYFKERFLAPDHPRLGEMMSFSSKLRKLGVREEVGFGPTRAELTALLYQRGLNKNLNKRRGMPEGSKR